MTHLLTTLTERWPRCDECGALLIEAWDVEHAPHCTHSNPQEASTP